MCVHHDLLNKEAGRLPPTAVSNIQTCQWTFLLTMQQLEVRSGADAGLIGRHDVLVVSQKQAGTKSVVRLAVAGITSRFPGSKE